MFKLFALTLAMTDTGSIAMTQIATNFISRQACERAASELFPLTFERDLNGHHLALRSSAECRFDGDELPPPVQAQRLPPQGRLPGQMLPNFPLFIPR